MKAKKRNSSGLVGFFNRILYGSKPEPYAPPKVPTEEEIYEYQQRLIKNSFSQLNNDDKLNNDGSRYYSQKKSIPSSDKGFENDIDDWLRQPIFGLDAKKDLHLSSSMKNKEPQNTISKEGSKERVVSEETFSKVENELQSLKSMIEKMSAEKNLTSTNVIDVNQQISLSIMEQLKDYDFSKEFQEKWHSYILENSENNYEISKSKLYEFVQHEVRRLVYLGCDTAPKVHVFVGPPGVGKTTTIAKVASNEILQYQRKVGLITVDTYRIGAVEQLKTYASILNVPLKVVHNTEELKQALAELEDCDRVIIDSMGRTHRDYDNLKELKELFSVLERYTCYLVLSMSTKYRQLSRIMTEFQFLNYNHLILTKLDESERNENILNLFYQFQYPIAYLCTGQEVPTDIEIPTFKRVLELIWGEKYE